MTQYDNTNRGVLFKNDRKAKDTHPDYTGSLNVDGVEHFMDAWIKEGQKGKFMSISIKRKDKQPDAAPPAPRSPKPTPQSARGSSGFDEMDDDLPPF